MLRYEFKVCHREWIIGSLWRKNSEGYTPSLPSREGKKESEIEVTKVGFLVRLDHLLRLNTLGLLTDPTIHISGLTKKYGNLTALDAVNFSVSKGGISGIIGPNGAGKTTLIKSIVGSLRPTSGSVSVLGLDPLKNKSGLRQRIGYMPQDSALYEDLSARENIRFFGRAHNIRHLEEKITRIIAFTELTGRENEAVHNFSGGMIKRVSLACALIHDPEVIILDEPTAAVDPRLRQRSWEMFRQLAQRGVTLLISTHLMDEASLCDRITILRNGRVLVADTPQAILERGRSKMIVKKASTITEESIGSRPEDLAGALHRFGLDPSVDSVTIQCEGLEEIVLSLINREEA